MGTPPGYRRIISQSQGAAGVVVPGPEAARRYWGQDDYLQAACDRDGETSQLIRQIPQITLVGVPLVDCDQFERWCTQLDIAMTDPQSRARWGAEQIAERTRDDHGMPVIQGVYPLAEAGDLLALSLALAAGWDGVTPVGYYVAPPEQGWSRISVEVLGERIVVALHMVRPACQAAWLHLTSRIGQPGVMTIDDLPDPGVTPGPGWSSYQCRNVVLWRR